MHLDIVSLGRPGCTRVVLQGELDLASTPVAQTGLGGFLRPGMSWELDLSGVTFMDTSGIHLLEWVRRRAETVGATATVTSVSTPARRVVTLAGAERLLWVLQAPSGHRTT